MRLLPSSGGQSTPHNQNKTHSKGSTTLDLLDNPSRMPNQGLGLIHTLTFSPLHHQERISLIHTHVFFYNLPPNMQK